MLQSEKDLQHFIDLARKGKHGFCSGGERRARLLAKAILEYAGGLDHSAMNGAREFMEVVAWEHNKAHEMIG